MSTAEDFALSRLTTARPHELAAAIGPRLRASTSVELVAGGAPPRLAAVPDVPAEPRPAVPV
ncbi:hypothetical protein AB0L40_16675, partial [Patulibacter sp. NPDC049589]|uniref:hypothetical protein n=1 Tax=Patulibacter sp. NPDC049589 TaxID=3154731 RepID=UPI0034151D22